MAMKSKEHKKLRILLTGGGTGGHLFPGIAAAEALRNRLPGSEVMFVGTHRKMDKTSLGKYGYRLKSIHCYGLKGKSAWQLVKALLVLPLSLLEASYHILTFRPQLVVGVGGYVTGPVIAAARILGVTSIIHEQNSIPGLANRKLGSLADRVCLSIPGSEKYFPATKSVLTGNPVRKEILEVAVREKKEKEVTVVILGGSQGAKGVNRLAVEALTLSSELNSRLRIIHQTGQADSEMVKKAYETAGVSATVEPFFHDMVSVYLEADIVVSRAGATTLAELSVLGLPAVLIPYPYAADNHQEKNGAHYVSEGGAMMFLEKELSGTRLAEIITGLINNPGELQQMGENMRKLAFPGAAEEIVDVCLEQMQK